MKEIDITFPVGRPFIFFVYLGDELRYIGCTEDLNKKAFIFPFEYDRITGYFYEYPWVIEDEVDKLILERKPTMCKPRYGLKLSNLKDWVKQKLKIRFSKGEWKEICRNHIGEDDVYIYDGEAYITKNARETLLLSINPKYGTRNI